MEVRSDEVRAGQINICADQTTDAPLVTDFQAINLPDIKVPTCAVPMTNEGDWELSYVTVRFIQSTQKTLGSN